MVLNNYIHDENKKKIITLKKNKFTVIKPYIHYYSLIY